MPVLTAPDLAAALPTQLRLTTVYCLHFTALSDELIAAVEYAGHDCAPRPLAAPQLLAA